MNRIISWSFNRINWILKNRWWFILFWFLTTYIIGFFGYYMIIPKYPNEPFVSDSIYLSALVWALINMIDQSTDNLMNFLILISKVMSILGVFFIIAVTFLKDWLSNLKLQTIRKIPYQLIIGLGKNNRDYLENETNFDETIIIDVDANNPYISMYKDRGLGVFIGTVDEYFTDASKIDISKICHIIISVGDDRINIEIAEKINKFFEKASGEKEKENPLKIFIHLENRTFLSLFSQNNLLSDINPSIEFKPFSYNDLAVRSLLQEHSLYGDFDDLINKDKDSTFRMVVIGEGNLAERVIYYLGILAAFPQGNQCEIHIIGENSENFVDRLDALYSEMESISWISLISHNKKLFSKDFYHDAIWHCECLTNVFICDDDESKNLELAISLYEKVYMEEANKKTLKTKIHFALFNNTLLGAYIDKNKDVFLQFNPFAEHSQICTKEVIMDETNEIIAKLIHQGYKNGYKPNNKIDIKEANNKWKEEKSYFKRESNKAQALHMKVKLDYLGLVAEESKFSSDILLKHNQKVFKGYEQFFYDTLKINCKRFSVLSKQLERKNVTAIQKNIMVKFFEKVLHSDNEVCKLAISEHERWNAFHCMNGWKYNAKINKDLKMHDCLIPFREFKEYEIKKTIMYDLYSVLYIPNYLADAGYALKKSKDQLA